MLVSLALVYAVGIIGAPALVQDRTTIQDAAPGVMLAQTPKFAEFIGRWVRTDGGYTIVIKSVDPNGKIDATYANPINISRAEASVEGSSLRIFIELRGAGYPGSTYTLTHVPTGDRLTGEYFQAAIRQKFDVIFLRAR